MLRAYRKIFMGTMSERWKEIVDLRPALRVPVALVVGGLLCYGFFPQSLVRMVTPVLHTYLTIDRHFKDMERCSHGAMSPCFTEQHRPTAWTQRGAHNVWQIARK
jgi:hypothetical protein